MDIWDWVWDMHHELQDLDQKELAGYMFKMPNDCCDGRHDQLDNYAEHAISMARKLKLNWVEIYLRHWRLQSKILHRAEPKKMIKEAVSLLEFANRPENKDCPQGMCAVQDLASCYAFFDGPGFAEERMAVAEESLKKINPEWPCYICIKSEYLDALYDLKDFQACLDYLDQVDKEMLSYGISKDRGHLLLKRVKVLAELQNHIQARNLLKKIINSGGGETFDLEIAITKSLVEALDKNYQLASEYLPDYELTKKSPSDRYLWARIKYIIIKATTPDDALERMHQLKEIAFDLLERGVYRDSFNIMAWLLELNYNNDNNELTSAMEAILSKLNRDLGAIETLQKLKLKHA